MQKFHLFVALFGLIALSSCSISHKPWEANGRDGGGYPTDYRFQGHKASQQPLNDLELGKPYPR